MQVKAYPWLTVRVVKIQYGPRMNSTSESLLLKLRKANDQQAWSKFVKLYTPLLFYWARQTGLQSQDAADLVQDVLTIVFRKLPDFEYDRNKSFRSWLRTVTLNRYREYGRKKSVSRDAVTGTVLNLIPAAAVAESTWDLSYQRSLFSTAMEILKTEFRPKTWDAVRKFVLEDRTAAEIASETGVSIWTIYAAKSRLLARLREELNGLTE